VEIPLIDQKCILAAREAVAGGAGYVVVGLPISAARDPLAVVVSMQKEIELVLASRLKVSPNGSPSLQTVS
jgi:orotidine-5'-phosphate decarboxylase